MSHIVLLGDSIFDNGVYVPGEPAVIDQLRHRLARTDSATLLAVDGDITADVARQLSRLPQDATHLFISVGGNDALGKVHVLDSRGGSVVRELTRAHEEFGANYRAMLDQAGACNRPTTLCTIYDSVPGLDKAAVMALSVFNDIILRAAIARGMPVIDLRLACSDVEDYSALSPIEPSAVGGAKIADALTHVLQNHDFTATQTSVYR